MPRSLVLASSPVALEGAEEGLSGNGSALQAVLTGFFVAAGADPGVLFSPLSILVGGLGSGVFAYDGRCRQPGREAKRPRGFLTEDQVPATALAAIPGSVAAAAIACAFQTGTTLLSCVRPGVASAKAFGAKGRAHLLEKAASLGATALQDNTVKRAFTTQFGVVEQGAVTVTDMIAADGLQARSAREGDAHVLPWEASNPEDSPLGEGHSIVAVDARGLFAAVTYSSLPVGLVLEPFEVTVPSLSVPVMRGVSRVTPGEALPMSMGSIQMTSASASQLTQVSAVPRPKAAPMAIIRDPNTQEVAAVTMDLEVDAEAPRVQSSNEWAEPSLTDDEFNASHDPELDMVAHPDDESSYDSE